MTIPNKIDSVDKLFATMNAFKQHDLDWRSGKTLGYVYDAGEEVSSVAKRAYCMFMTENGLDPTSFSSLAKFENDVVAFARGHLNGDENVVGTFTSGGTESILLAVKTARDYCKARNPQMGQAEMILPTTAHAAFHKAAKYFGVKAVLVPVDSETFKVDPAAIEAAINDNTVLIVASATSYAHGVIDPIPAIAEIAKSRDCLFHVDACIGGFLLPYFERLGDQVELWDFRVDGVTSISMDFHKYAYCPKGASVVLYRDKALRQFQIFACAQWTGYSVVNCAVQSSKSGGPLAAAWAVLNFIGDEGYLEIARNLRNATQELITGLKSIDGVGVLGNPEMSLIGFTCDRANVFHVVDEMKIRGWYVQAQFEFDNSPANIHISLAPSNIPHIPALIEDLKVAIDAAEKLGPEAVPAELLEMIDLSDTENLMSADFSALMGMLGVGGDGLPDRMATINGLLNAMPPMIREPMLCGFMNELFTPTTLKSATEETTEVLA